MKKFRFLFLVLALILVVGMTTGVIVRKQTGSQTVLQHSGGGSAAATTPATTGDDEPAAPEPEVFKIPVLIREDYSQYFTVSEDGVEVEPFDVFEYAPPSSNAESKGGDHDPDPEPELYSKSYVRYLVDPTCSLIEYDHSARAGDGWCYVYYFWIDFSDSSVIRYGYDRIDQSSGSINLSSYLFVVVD